MGACMTVDEAAVRSRHIDKQNKADYREEKRVVKLLVLGTGGSGKSGKSGKSCMVEVGNISLA